MKIFTVILSIILLSACSYKKDKKNERDKNSQKNLTSEVLSKGNTNQKSKDKFQLVYCLKIDNGGDSCSIFTKPIEHFPDEVFSSLIITNEMSDTLYSIDKWILTNKKGMDLKIYEKGFYGYRFISKNKDGFVLQALHDSGKSVSDNIWIKWDNPKKLFEVQKAP